MFFARLDTNGTITYATYHGGSDDEFTYAMAVDGTGRAYVAGDTGVEQFPRGAAAVAGFAERPRCVRGPVLDDRRRRVLDQVWRPRR